VTYALIEGSQDTLQPLISVGFPTGVASAVSANGIPVFAVQKVPSESSANWEAPFVANTELLYEHAPAGRERHPSVIFKIFFKNTMLTPHTPHLTKHATK
jgi:hypothetical protein